jgi:nucleotide-binding universal stress UspA family protein
LKETERPIDIKRILFATDFSFYSSKAKEHALLLAAKLDAAVTVIHVIEWVDAIDHEDEGIKQWCADLKKELKDKLEEELSGFRQNQIEVTGELVFGTPWHTLVEYAENMVMDLIVIGTHGARTAEGRPLLGTTSHKTVLASKTPVLVVRADHTQQ